MDENRKKTKPLSGFLENGKDWKRSLLMQAAVASKNALCIVHKRL